MALSVKRSFTLPASPSVLPSANAMPTASARFRAFAEQAVSEREGAHLVHGVAQRRIARECRRLGRRVEHAGGGQLAFEAREVGARRLGHRLARRLAGGGVGRHQGQRLVPGAGQRLAQRRVVRERGGVDHQQVDDLARNVGRIEHQRRAGQGLDLGQLRVPGDDGIHVCRRGGGHDVGIAGVDHGDVALGQAHRVQRPRQQVVRNRQLDQVHLAALDGLQVRSALEHHAVVAVRKNRPTISAVESTPPAAGMVRASMLVITQPSKAPAVYWLMDST